MKNEIAIIKDYISNYCGGSVDMCSWEIDILIFWCFCCIGFVVYTYIHFLDENKKKVRYHILFIICIIFTFFNLYFIIDESHYHKKFNVKKTQIQYDTTIVIKNSVADTLITYQIKKI